MENVKVIIIVSGKRKSGKDYVTNMLKKNMGEENCYILRVADPIKLYFCKRYKLDFDMMLNSSSYKEKYRTEMIKWSDQERNKDPDIFRRKVYQEALISCLPIWIVSDARILEDVEYFRNITCKHRINFYCIRVETDLVTRQKRNWVYTKGADDLPSECGLDLYDNWDHIFHNSNGDDIITAVNDFSELVMQEISFKLGKS